MVVERETTRAEKRLENATKQQETIRRHSMESLPVADLIELLGDTDWDIIQAAQAVLFARGTETIDGLIAGLRHADPRIRAISAGLMDHLGDDRCTEPLCATLKSDPQEAVRRNALHSLACQGCKVCPLSGDIIAPLIDAALHDRSIVVRRRAVQYLVGQRRDDRATVAARQLLESETDITLLLRARRVLDWHSKPAGLT